MADERASTEAAKAIWRREGARRVDQGLLRSSRGDVELDIDLATAA